jgi:hypothetical protein
MRLRATEKFSGILPIFSAPLEKFKAEIVYRSFVQRSGT